MWIDTHAHFDDEAFDKDREALLRFLPSRGIQTVINPGCTLDSSRMAVEMAEEFPHVYAAVGIHPENCADFVPEQIGTLRELAKHPKVVAIGEIGLDYYWPENPAPELQKEVLRAQMTLAGEMNLPVIVHDREAHGDTMEIVREFSEVRGVFHCFAGSAEMAQELVQRGWLLSFNGAITFKNARKAPEVIRAIPLEKIMLETDSPYLTPVPYRGERNDSTRIPLVAEKIAQIKGMAMDEVAQVTTATAKAFFSLP